MASQYDVIRQRTTRQKIRFWECPVDTVLKTPDSGFDDPEVGEVVSVNANDQLVRYNPASTGGNTPYGVLLGFPVDPLVYPAFAGHYDGRALVGVSHNAELTVPFYNNGASTADGVGAGEFLPSDRNVFIPANATVAIVRHSTTGRWGIPVSWNSTNNRWQYSTPSGTNEHFRLVRILDQVGGSDYRYALVRQIVD